MKKFRLIKEYPGSPKLGYEVDFGNSQVIYNAKTAPLTFYLKDIENYPDFWEEVKPKEWEILSFKDTADTKPEIWRQCEKDYTLNGIDTYPLNHMLAYLDLTLSIYSVRRANDGEIFTIGDRVKYSDNSGMIKLIEKFHISDYLGQMMITCSDNGYSSYSIGLLMKVKQLLFTTEDGVDIYEGDKYFILDAALNEKVSEYTAMSFFTKSCFYRYFSTKEAAEEYILLNKPCLSINDLKTINKSSIGGRIRLNTKQIKELVKSKL